MKGGEEEVQTERPFLLAYKNYWGNSEVIWGGGEFPLTGLDKTLKFSTLVVPWYRQYCPSLAYTYMRCATQLHTRVMNSTRVL
jgi:hypothetical protein